MRTNLLLIISSERLILSWDPSQLILTREYELGFQDVSSEGGYRAVYMGWSVHCEPSDQTDLRNDIDAILCNTQTLGVINFK